MLGCAYVWSNWTFLHISQYYYYHYYHYYYCLHFERFSHQRQLVVFHWGFGDSKSPQVSSTHLSILAVLNNVVVWMVSTRNLISKSSSPFNNPLFTVLKAPVTYMFHIFFNSVAIPSFYFLQFYSAVSRDRKVINLAVMYYYYYYKVWSSGWN